MPFGSMASVVTDKPEERTKLSRSRAFGWAGRLWLFIPSPMLIWDKNNNPVASGYLILVLFLQYVYYSLYPII